MGVVIMVTTFDYILAFLDCWNYTNRSVMAETYKSNDSLVSFLFCCMLNIFLLEVSFLLLSKELGGTFLLYFAETHQKSPA